jgi:transcriptional regulator with XRE-family HTH domain
LSNYICVTASLSPPEQAKDIGRRLAKQRKALGLTQAAAAEQSGLSLSMLRRAESHGCIPLQQLLKLANTIGCQLRLDNAQTKLASGTPDSDLSQRHSGLVWSNSRASKEVYIRKALLNPRFGQLLKLAKDFGLKSLKDEWTNLTTQFPGETHRVEVEVTRILRNMETAAAATP